MPENCLRPLVAFLRGIGKGSERFGAASRVPRLGSNALASSAISLAIWLSDSISISKFFVAGAARGDETPGFDAGAGCRDLKNEACLPTEFFAMVVRVNQSPFGAWEIFVPFGMRTWTFSGLVVCMI